MKRDSAFFLSQLKLPIQYTVIINVHYLLIWPLFCDFDFFAICCNRLIKMENPIRAHTLFITLSTYKTNGKKVRKKVFWLNNSPQLVSLSERVRQSLGELQLSR